MLYPVELRVPIVHYSNQFAVIFHKRFYPLSNNFKDFTFRTLKSWGRARRVVGKTEHLSKGANPHFLVTAIADSQFNPRSLYECPFLSINQPIVRSTKRNWGMGERLVRNEG